MIIHQPGSRTFVKLEVAQCHPFFFLHLKWNTIIGCILHADKPKLQCSKSFRPVCHLWGWGAFLRLFELANPRLFCLLILAVYFHRRIAFWAVYRIDFSWSPELDFLKGTYAFVDPNQDRIRSEYIHLYRIFSIKRRTPNKCRVQINAGSTGSSLK